MAVRVEMVADVVCPYCYIGLHRLERAVAAAGVPVEIEYTPFILRRHLPKEGVDKHEVFVRQFGSAQRADAVMDGVKTAAAADGLCFDLRGQRAGNSEDAHRLLLWARAHGKELPLFKAMVEAYNCERQWLGDHAVLRACAAKAGLPEPEAASVLADAAAGLPQLEAGLGRAAALGVSGVPFFRVGNRTLGGAAPAEQLRALLLDAHQCSADGGAAQCG